MIGERLKEVRRDKHDTQASLAKKLNVSLSTVKSWENEKSSPSHDLLVQICKLYGVSADFLLGISDEDPLWNKEKRNRLTPQNKELLKAFEEFIVYKQRQETNK